MTENTLPSSGVQAERQPEWLSRYHASMLPFYGPAGVPLEPSLGLHSLGTEDCPAWQEALAGLPRERPLLLDLGGELLRQGRDGEALALYRWLPEVFPDDPLMLHNLGALLQGAGDHQEAEHWLRRALEMAPLRQDTLLTLAQLLSASDPAEARALLARLDPLGPLGFARLLVALGLDLADQPEVGRSLVEPLLSLAEGDPDRFGSLLALLVGRGQLALALELAPLGPPQADPLHWALLMLPRISHSQAEQDPAAGDLLLRLEVERGDVPSVRLALGELDRAARRFQKAEDHCRRLLDLGGDRGPACAQLAGVLFSLGRLAEAREMLDEALRHLPLQADSRITRGLLALALGDPDGSRHWFRTGLRLMPRCGKGYHTLANILRLGGEISVARDLLQEARRRCPDDATIHTDLGTTLLLLGAYPEGWQAYESRTHPSVVPVRSPIGMARWDGRSPLDELVIVAEQGVGDLVQFMRYAPFLRLAIPRVSILADERVTTLLRHSELFSEVYCHGDTIRFNGEVAWLPLLSVAGLLGVTPELVLIEAPFLQPDAEAMARWAPRLREELAPGERLIGLHWQGNPATEASSLVGRSFPLETLAPLADLPDVRFVSLQKGPGSEQLACCSFRDRFIPAQEEVDRCWDFAETTGLLEACDLLITSDSAIAHLAGALGRPVWLLLQHTPDWRWGLEGEGTFWYPDMRLFRQSRCADWASVISCVRGALLTDSARIAELPTESPRLNPRGGSASHHPPDGAG